MRLHTCCCTSNVARVSVRTTRGFSFVQYVTQAVQTIEHYNANSMSTAVFRQWQYLWVCWRQSRLLTGTSVHCSVRILWWALCVLREPTWNLRKQDIKGCQAMSQDVERCRNSGNRFLERVRLLRRRKRVLLASKTPEWLADMWLLFRVCDMSSLRVRIPT